MDFYELEKALFSTFQFSSMNAYSIETANLVWLTQLTANMSARLRYSILKSEK